MVSTPFCTLDTFCPSWRLAPSTRGKTHAWEKEGDVCVDDRLIARVFIPAGPASRVFEILKANTTARPLVDRRRWCLGSRRSCALGCGCCVGCIASPPPHRQNLHGGAVPGVVHRRSQGEQRVGDGEVDHRCSGVAGRTRLAGFAGLWGARGTWSMIGGWWAALCGQIQHGSGHGLAVQATAC